MLKSLVIVFLLFTAHPSFARQILLTPGQTEFLPAAEGLEIEVGQSEVIKVKDRGEKIQIIARKTGETSLRIGEKKYQVTVVTKNTLESYKTLKWSFRRFAKVHVIYRNKKLFLTGSFSSMQEWETLWNLAPTLNRWTLAIKTPLSLRNEIQKNFESFLQSLHLPPAKLIYHPSVQILISEKNKKHKALFEEFLKPYGINVKQHPDSLQSGKLLRIQVVIAEVKKGYLQKYGLQWPSHLRAQVVPDFLWEEGDDSSLFQANFLENRGHGKVLAAPNLLCESGFEAEFMAGGEIPIPSTFGRIVWKKHGILLKIKPQVSLENHIQLHLVTEISSLDFSSAVNGVPGLASHRLSTVFSLQKPQPIVLSGLVKKDQGQQFEGLPWLSRIPIIGPLFSSRNYQDNETEMIIVIYPSHYRSSDNQGESAHAKVNDLIH